MIRRCLFLGLLSLILAPTLPAEEPVTVTLVRWPYT